MPRLLMEIDMSNAPTSEQDAFAARLVDYAEEAGRRLLERVMWISAVAAAIATNDYTDEGKYREADDVLAEYRKRFGGSE